ncbi:MAG: sugar transferase [Bacteroidota bacterium]
MKKKLVIISLFSRRDLHHPLRHFKNFEVFHLYKNTPFNDMTSDEKGDACFIQYTGLIDLFKKIRDIRPDVIQGIEPLTFPAGCKEYIAILMAHIIFRIPFFFPSFENRPIYEKFGATIGFCVKIYSKIYVYFSNFVIVLNNGAEQNFRSMNVPAKKIRKLMWGCWGVDTNEFIPDKDKARITKKRDILFVGRLEEGKGVRYLLEAFKIVHEKYKDVKLIFIGDGFLKPVIEYFASTNGLSSNIEMKGTVENRELPDCFRKAFLTVAPSITTQRWEEQVGRVNLQSMACGTPVVSTLSGAIPEYVPDGKAGILVEERDSDMLAHAILDLLEDNEKSSLLGDFGRKFVIENYDESKNINKAESFLIEEMKVKQKKIGLIYSPDWVKYKDSNFQRLFDILISGLGILVFLPVFMFIAIAILIIEGRPVFYKQERVGKYGKLFSIIKFRTMIKEAEKGSGPVLSNEEDDRITNLGKILRATAMDELPQLLNIFKGEMSIVGPRAERPFFVEKFKKEIPLYDMRHQIKPGLTGLAQVYGRYNTQARDKLRFDLLSVRKQGIQLYFRLIFLSFWITVRGKWTAMTKQR